MGSTDKVHNFGAGPGKIPKEVLEEVQAEFLSYNNSGFSITELSHRSEEYAKINNDAQDDLRKILCIPQNYKILFLHGGGQGLFSAIPMNLIGKSGSADYIQTGIWSTIAANEAKKYGVINNVFDQPIIDGKIPCPTTWKLDKYKASYAYYCDNETIQGIELTFVPDTVDVPLIVDMSSNLLTKKLDVLKYGAIFAAVQKNLGTAGLGIIIIREDLIGRALDMCPSILDFRKVSEYNSILNTPPIFSVYLFGKVLKWVKRQGGVEVMERESIRKSQLLYTTIDNSNGFYSNHIDKKNRSRINIPFKIKNGDKLLEEQFLQEAETKKMYQIKGHKLVGGIRVSLYNATSYEDVGVLVQFMKDFRKNHDG